MHTTFSGSVYYPQKNDKTFGYGKRYNYNPFDSIYLSRHSNYFNYFQLQTHLYRLISLCNGTFLFNTAITCRRVSKNPMDRNHILPTLLNYPVNGCLDRRITFKNICLDSIQLHFPTSSISNQSGPFAETQTYRIQILIAVFRQWERKAQDRIKFVLNRNYIIIIYLK